MRDLPVDAVGSQLTFAPRETAVCIAKHQTQLGLAVPVVMVRPAWLRTVVASVLLDARATVVLHSMP